MTSKPIEGTRNGQHVSSTGQRSEAGAQSSDNQEEIFEVLSNERRRYVLAYLKRCEDGSTDLSTLVTHVAALENDVPPEQVRSDDRKSVYVGLRQTHLPKMDEYDLIEYDPNRGDVALTEAAEKAHTYMEYVPEHDIPWSYHYFGISAIMTAITVLAWQGVFPFGGLDGLAVSALTIAVFVVSAAVHIVYTRRHRLDRIIDLDETG